MTGKKKNNSANGNNNINGNGSKKRKGRSSMLRSDRVLVPASGTTVLTRQSNPYIGVRGVGNQTTYICNTEVARAVTLVAAGAYTTARTHLAPFIFTWMNGTARNYSKWRFIRCRLIYIPTCPTTTTGRIAFKFGYDGLDAAPASLTEVQIGYKSVTTAPWAGYEGANLMNHDGFPTPTVGAVCMDLDTSRLQMKWYSYTSSLPAVAADYIDYIPAHVDVSSDGGVAGTVGSLFIKYEIECIEPIYFANN